MAAEDVTCPWGVDSTIAVHAEACSKSWKRRSVAGRALHMAWPQKGAAACMQMGYRGVALNATVWLITCSSD